MAPTIGQKKRRAAWLVLALVAGCSPGSPGVTAPSLRSPSPARTAAIVPGRALARHHHSAALARIAQARRPLAGDVELVTLPASGTAETLATIDALAADPDIEWIAPDHVYDALSVPAGANDALLDQQWALAAVNAAAAWQKTHADGVIVAVLDTGYGAHPDLPQPGDRRFARGFDFVSCGTPRPDPIACPQHPECANTGDCDGWDGDATDPGPGEFHGQHVAGIIGALTNNGIGVAGLAWNATLLPVRVLGSDLHGTDSDLFAAIEWLAGNAVAGAPPPPPRPDVINLSLGSGDPSPDGRCNDGVLLQQAIDDATAAGIVVVVAAGNDSADLETGNTDHPCRGVPASLRNVITVGAAALDDTGASYRAGYSDWGAKIAVMAPGGPPAGGECDPIFGASEVLSTVDSSCLDGYGFLFGTSQATPFVSATVALLKSVNPNLSTAAIDQILRTSAAPLGIPCDHPGGCGGGLLDASRAIDFAEGARAVDGPVVVGGCAMAGAAPPGAAAALALLAIVVVVARRRARARAR